MLLGKNWKKTESALLDEATAARTISELSAEIESLKLLEKLAANIRNSEYDTKWRELSNLLSEIFVSQNSIWSSSEYEKFTGSNEVINQSSTIRKLVIFTEHRDTLNYLAQRISTFLGKSEILVQIHGGMGSTQRRNTQELFLNDPDAQILLATDAAGEGINLQIAHLMVNYDLPWNPNRLEQRFGQIHRIGQTKVCHLWNLIAGETREGYVYQRLLMKLSQARTTLGGQVFDVLGKVRFEGRSLRDLLIEAVRHADHSKARMRLDQIVDQAVDQKKLQDLIQAHELTHELMDTNKVAESRVDFARASARRLLPNYLESFFLEAFRELGGTIHERESRRYQISNVPQAVRNWSQEYTSHESVHRRYDRITFDKALIARTNSQIATLIYPGHSLLSSVLGVMLRRHGDVLNRGTVLVDDTNFHFEARVLIVLKHSIHEEMHLGNGSDRAVSQRMIFIELHSNGRTHHLTNAPYLDYRSLREDDPNISEILSRPELSWINRDLKQDAERAANTEIVPKHFESVRTQREESVKKTRVAVKDRLTKEIAHWNRRAEDLRFRERSGVVKGEHTSRDAIRRAESLVKRLRSRMNKFADEEKLVNRPPQVLGGAVIVSRGLIDEITGVREKQSINTQKSATRARQIVMSVEECLGYKPIDREPDKLGYDIESLEEKTGKLRLIEVKGRVSGANTITVTKNEIVTALNYPNDYILAIVEFLEQDNHRVHYVRKPFETPPDWATVSVNYSMDEMIGRATAPN